MDCGVLPSRRQRQKVTTSSVVVVVTMTEYQSMSDESPRLILDS